MRRGTTPDYIFTIDGHDLRRSTVFVTIRQDEKQITLTGERLEVGYDGMGEGRTTIAFRLTQEETLGLRDGQAQAQVRWVEADGTAMCTGIDAIGVAPVLLEEVIRHADGAAAADSTAG